MVGRPEDTEIKELIDFSNPNGTEQLRQRAIAENHQTGWWFIDYFVFSHGLYQKKVSRFVIKRVVWDNWLTCMPATLVCRASNVVPAIDQNHDYHPLGKQGAWNEELAHRNLPYPGGWNHLVDDRRPQGALVPRGFETESG